MKTAERNLSVTVWIIKSIFADTSSNDDANKAACSTEKYISILIIFHIWRYYVPFLFSVSMYTVIW
jgi:hypothetical protein